jgi:cobalt-zinc-cadmium efflux system protein
MPVEAHIDHSHDKEVGYSTDHLKDNLVGQMDRAIHDEHDDHGHGHSHGAGHSHAPKDFGKAFFIGIVLNTGFVVAEVVYGLLSNSLALLADAGHNLGDVLGLALAWGASILVKRKPSKHFTYGLRSTSILAAVINAVVLLVVTGGIAWEAIQRFRHPGTVEGTTVIAIAAIGVVINTATALLFMSGRKGDLNVRAAFMHMAGDAAITLGVVIAGFTMIYTGWTWLDPAVSLAISVLVIFATWGLLRESIKLALHAVPEGIDIEKVKAFLASIDGVTAVHDLHIWGMSTTETALTAHLVMPAGYPGDAKRSAISKNLEKNFSIGHTTLQIESGDVDTICELAPDHVV